MNIWRRVRDHIWGPTGSILLHVVIVALLLRLTTGETTKADNEVIVTIGPEEIRTFEPRPVDMEAPPLDDLPEAAPAQPPDESDTEMTWGGLETPGAGLPLPSGHETEIVELPATLAPMVESHFVNRAEAARGHALDEYAHDMKGVTEPAVNKALAWLKNHQNVDGSWGPNKPAMTGLALLTFLAHGETTASTNYGDTVTRAIRFLVDQQDEAGAFHAINQQGAYAHAIATYAISESYGMTRIPSLKPVMENAVSVILNGQQPRGGWDYFYKNDARRDTSVAGWQIQALKAAMLAGSENTGVLPALERAVVDLKSAQNAASGLFGYTDYRGGFRDSLTGVAVLCLELTGHGDDPETALGAKAMKKFSCDWGKPTDWPLYAWYYITQAKFHRGGSSWASWNERFAREFTKNQNEDGSWTTPADREEKNQGPVYATALAALTLQVYYRQLPSFQKVELNPEINDEEDPVTVELI